MAHTDIIKNEIEKKHKRRKGDEEKELIIPKTVVDAQRMQLEKLMADPDKMVELPEGRRKWEPRAPPEFVRHVMGSSAGAGSGEFHVYRGIRRREINRVNFIEQQAEEDKLDEIYHEKLEENKSKAEMKTAKKRKKRQKRKQKQIAKKAKPIEENVAEKSHTSPESEEEDSGEEEPHFVIGGK